MNFAFPFAYYSRIFRVQQEWVTYCVRAKLWTSSAVLQSAVSKQYHRNRMAKKMHCVYQYISTTNVSNGKKWAFLSFGRIPLDAAGKLLPPRACIHLISSSPSSILVDLARHRAGCPWAESLSRSSVYRVSSHQLK